MEDSPSARPDRRLLSRRACQLAVRYRSRAGTRRAWHPAIVVDVSSTGCRLRLGQPVSAPGEVDLEFDRPLADGTARPTIAVRGEVVWSRPEGLSHQIGVHFSEGSEPLDALLAALY